MSDRDNSSDILLLGGLAALAWFVLSKAQTVNGLNFVPRGISFVGGTVQVNIGVQNPSSQDLVFNSLSATLYLNGTNVGNVASFVPTTIAANNETVIPIFVTPSLLGAASVVAASAQSGSFDLATARLQGTANISNTMFPLDVSLV